MIEQRRSPMKLQYLIYIVFFSLIVQLFGQQNRAAISLLPIPGSDGEWEFNLNVDLPIAPANGFVLEIPEGVELIPIAMQINKHDVYLQNILTIPQRDSVIAWQRVSTGLLLLCRKNLLDAGENFSLKCISTGVDLPLDVRRVNLKEIISKPDGIKISNRVFATGTIPLPSNR